MIRNFAGKSPTVSDTAYVDATALVVGDVYLGEDVSIWPTSVVRGDVNRISIADSSNIQDGSVLHVTHDGPFSPGGVALSIGHDVTVGHRCILHACNIGDRCLIGMGSIVMDEVEIEDEVYIGAGSLVPPGKRLASGYLYRGSPAVQVRELTDEERDMIRYSARHYVRLKDKHTGRVRNDGAR